MKSIINRHTTALKKIAGISLVLILGLIGFLPTQADARLIFTTEDDGVNADAYHLDNDDSSADFIDLAFGTGLTNRMRYDIVNNQFLLNQDLNLEGNALEDFRVENSASALACAAAGDKGRMYYDTVADNLFFCDGTQWVSTATVTSTLAGDGLVDNAGALDVNVDDLTIEIDSDVVQVKDGGITSAKILDATITSDDLGTDSVDSDEIATDAVTTAEIAADTILAGDIATGAVTTDEILDGTIETGDINLAGFSIGSGQITDGSLTSDDLGTDSVDSDEIATGAVTTTEILDGTVGTVDMAAGANDTFLTTDGSGNVVWELKSSFVSSSLASGSMWIGDGTGAAAAVVMSGDATIDNAGVLTIAADAVTTAEIAADTILAGDIATGAVTTDEILDGTIETGDINLAGFSIGSGQITDGSLTSDDLGTDSVDSDEIATGAVTTTEILDGTVGTVDLNASGAGNDKRLTTDGSGNMAWVDDNSLDDSLTSANIFVGNGSNVATGVAMSGDATINNAGALTIANDAITTAKIAAGAVELSDLATDSVNSAKIVDSSITSDDLGTDSVDSDEIAADAVTTAEIAADTILAGDIATGAVTTDEILDSTIAVVDLNASGAGNDKILTTDGSGAMIWVDDAAVEREVSAHVAPEFSNFTLRADGSNNKGTLESDHDTTANKNYYKWATRKTGAAHDYDVVFQWMIPDDFESWSTTTDSIEVDFKTDTTTATDNKLDITMTDTAGSAVTLAGTAANMVSSTADTWVEDQVVAASSLAGTFTPGEYVTITIKMSSKATTTANRNPAYLGAFNFNYVAK